ncbi:ComEA family DNA-binding protein [Desulfocurvus sp. DL9XJH121]
MKRILPLLILALALAALPALAADDSGKLNLNTATVEQLAQIPEIGEDLAKAIIELREENGEFVDMEELLDVDGVDPALLRKLDKYLFIKPASSCNC